MYLGDNSRCSTWNSFFLYIMNIAGKIIDVHKRRIYPGIVTIKAGKIESDH
jgi:hypothetical protein